MAVEGLTPEGLDSRECNQLVLVVAQETDGIQTETVRRAEPGSLYPV